MQQDDGVCYFSLKTPSGEHVTTHKFIFNAIDHAKNWLLKPENYSKEDKMQEKQHEVLNTISTMKRKFSSR